MNSNNNTNSINNNEIEIEIEIETYFNLGQFSQTNPYRIEFVKLFFRQS